MFGWISKIFGGVNKTIETLDISGNEKARIKNELGELQVELSTKLIDLEMKVLETRASLAAAETQSDKFIVYAWRPLTSMTLLGLLVLMCLGIIPLQAELWTLSTAFLGLTTAGRGIEKSIKANRLGK